MGGGAVGAKISLLYMDKWNAMLFMFLITILWEMLEFVMDDGFPGIIKTYGSIERWLYDSFGDVLGAMLMAFIVVI